MAVTVTPVANRASGQVAMGSEKAVMAKITGDTSYTTGGYVVTPGMFGLSRIEEMYILSSSGYIGEYIPTTGAIKLYTSGGGGTFTGSALATHAHSNLSIEKESVAVAANVGTLAAIPADITYVYASAAGTVGPKTMIPDPVVPAAGQVAVNFATGVLTFAVADAVTAAQVTYTPEVAGAGGGKGIQAISAGTPAGTISGAVASEVANGTNLSALTNLSVLVIGV